MGLILALNKGDIFNIGYRRYIVTDVQPAQGCRISELGGDNFDITPATAIAVGKATIREGLRTSHSTTKLYITCDEAIPIWRGRYDKASDAELLAPVPLVHLESALDVLSEQGRVAFGSDAWEVFLALDGALGGTPCRCYIYASHGPVLPVPRATWQATYLQRVESNSMGAHRKETTLRPKSTSYPPERWAVFWEVTDLRKLDKDDQILISQFRGLEKKTNYQKAFRPERPMLVEPL